MHHVDPNQPTYTACLLLCSIMYWPWSSSRRNCYNRYLMNSWYVAPNNFKITSLIQDLQNKSLSEINYEFPTELKIWPNLFSLCPAPQRKIQNSKYSQIGNKSYENVIMTSIRCVSQNRTSDDVMMTSQFIISRCIHNKAIYWTHSVNLHINLFSHTDTLSVDVRYVIGWYSIRFVVIHYPL